MSAPLSLFDVLSQVKDPRSRHGRRHPLSAILALAVVAMLSGSKGYQGIAQFGRDHGIPLAHLLGFRRGQVPSFTHISPQAAFNVAFASLRRTIQLSPLNSREKIPT